MKNIPFYMNYHLLCLDSPAAFERQTVFKDSEHYSPGIHRLRQNVALTLMQRHALPDGYIFDTGYCEYKLLFFHIVESKRSYIKWCLVYHNFMLLLGALFFCRKRKLVTHFTLSIQTDRQTDLTKSRHQNQNTASDQSLYGLPFIERFRHINR